MEARQAKERKGLKVGVTGEWTVIAKVKPGHEKAIREVAESLAAKGAEQEDRILSIGTVHDYRSVLFDNDRWAMFMSNFDGDWDQYINDFFSKGAREVFDGAFSHCEGYPDISASDDAKKDWYQAHTHESANYKRAYPGSVKEIWRALEVQKAFQEVLDDPASAKALVAVASTPALKRLLDQAAK